MFKLTYSVSIAAICAVLIYSCAEDIEKPTIKANISSPVDIATNIKDKIFYVLNASFSHKYADGSILPVDVNGKHGTPISTPRMGRSLAITNNYLLAAFDVSTKENILGNIHLYDISTGNKPQLIKQWTLPNCAPLALKARSGYNYFALSCSNNDIYLGELNGSKSILSHIRTIPGQYVRRAIYLDKQRNLAFFFPTDLGKPDIKEMVTADQHSYDDQGKIIPNSGPNDFPDQIESSPRQANQIKLFTSPYQFVMIDINEIAEKRATTNSADFAFTDFSQSMHELRWIYFNSNNYDGSPDNINATTIEGMKHYRTNFWECQPDPVDDNSFYVSHRGTMSVDSASTNDIIKISYHSSPRVLKDSTGKIQTVPLTNSFFTFKRVYGFKGEDHEPEKTLPGSFVVTQLQGEKVLFVNNFRDAINFNNSSAFYQISAMSIGSRRWLQQISSTQLTKSYYNVAFIDGSLVTASFFANNLLFYRVKFGEPLTPLLQNQ